MGVPEQWEIRVGDAERQAMVDELRAHFSAGRLTLEEFEERAEKALAARKRADLVPLVADLPELRARPSGPPVRVRPPAPQTAWDVVFRIHAYVSLVIGAFLLLVSRGRFVVDALAVGLAVAIHYAIKVAVEPGERPQR